MLITNFCGNVGTQGRISDGGVFANTAICEALETNRIQLPEAQPLLGGNTPMPFTLVGDDVFPLKKFLMKPYLFCSLSHEQRIFNYR